MPSIARSAKDAGASESFLELVIEAIEPPNTQNITMRKADYWIRNFNRFLNGFKLELRHISVSRRKSTQEKFILASEALGSKFEKGSSPYQEFSDLFKLRDCLVHLKPEDLMNIDENQEFNYSGRELIRNFRAKGILQRHTSIESITLLASTAQTVKWACETASKMVIAILERIPESAFTQNNELLVVYRESFQPPTVEL